MRFKQVAVVQATEDTAPSIVALAEDGRLFVYKPPIYIGVRERHLIDSGGWERIPDPPLNVQR